MYGRARGYCVRELGTRRPPSRGARDGPVAPPFVALHHRADVPALFWAARPGPASCRWSTIRCCGSAKSPSVRALFTRALELDESWGSGAIHEAMIAVEGLPAIVGGSPVRAREHFDRRWSCRRPLGVRLCHARGERGGAGEGPGRVREALKQALAVDVTKQPELRLANLVAQKRARFLLANAERTDSEARQVSGSRVARREHLPGRDADLAAS